LSGNKFFEVNEYHSMKNIVESEEKNKIIRGLMDNKVAIQYYYEYSIDDLIKCLARDDINHYIETDEHGVRENYYLYFSSPHEKWINGIGHSGIYKVDTITYKATAFQLIE
jgi:hypothetical protein